MTLQDENPFQNLRDFLVKNGINQYTWSPSKKNLKVHKKYIELVMEHKDTAKLIKHTTSSKDHIIVHYQEE